MKKNIRKIPSLVEAKIKAFGDKQFVVGCTKHYTQAELASGQLSRFGISIGEDGLASGGSEHLPSRKAGRYSKRNQTGYCIVRKDLPKVMREIPYDIKDWYGERHTGTYLRPCYARVYVEPGNVKIQAQVVHASEDGANIAFRLSDVLSVADHDWRRRLLAGLNVMQENIAACDVEGADTPLEEYEVSEHVQWKIFPDGIGIPCIADMVIRVKSGEEAEKKKGVVIDHLNFLKQLGVKFFVKGNDSFNGYVGAVFPDGVCVFDNVHYGNAAYVLKDDWKSLTKKSRSELRQHFREVVTPVAHHGDWKGYVCQALSDLRRAS